MTPLLSAVRWLHIWSCLKLSLFGKIDVSSRTVPQRCLVGVVDGVLPPQRCLVGVVVGGQL